MKTIIVFALLAVLSAPAFSAAQTATPTTSASSQATSEALPRLQEWFVDANKRKIPVASALQAAAENAVASCYAKAVTIRAFASGDQEGSPKNRIYAGNREEAGLRAVQAAGGFPMTAEARYLGVGDKHGRGILLSCTYATPGPQGPAGVQGISGYDGANCYDGLPDMNGDGKLDVLDCRVAPSVSGDSDLRFTLGAGVLTDLLGEYNRLNVGLFLSPAWQDGSFVVRGIVAGTLGNADKYSSHTVEGLAAIVAGGQISDHFELGVGPAISGVYGQDSGVYNREFRFGGIASAAGRWDWFELIAGAGIVREQDQGTGETGLALQAFITAGIVFGAQE